MLKRLLLIFFFSGSLDSDAQDIDTANIDLSKFGTTVTFNKDHTYSLGCLHDYGKPCKCAQCQAKDTPDTLRAELLVTYTTRRWGIAHARDGYVVKKDGKVIRFLTDKKERFPPTTRLWGWVSCDEKILP